VVDTKRRRSATNDKRSDGPDARLRPPFDHKSARELDWKRARDGLVLWDYCLGLVARQKALQRADGRDSGHTARLLCFGRFVLLVVYGDPSPDQGVVLRILFRRHGALDEEALL
tara:strand:+ start:119 stop:460 length:342 start_codon:yes stop_codon:yes gene_type:complete